MTQPDTIVPEPGNPQALNRYSYALNNSIRYNDPTGHDPHWCTDASCRTDYYNSMMGLWRSAHHRDSGGDEIVAGVCGSYPELGAEAPGPNCINPDSGQPDTHFEDLDKYGATFGYDVIPVPYPGGDNAKIAQALEIGGFSPNKLICYSAGVDACLLHATTVSTPEDLKMVLIGGAYNAWDKFGVEITLTLGPSPLFENGFVEAIENLSERGAHILVIYDGNFVDTRDYISTGGNIQAVESHENHYTVDNPSSSIWPHVFNWMQDPTYQVPTGNYWMR